MKLTRNCVDIQVFCIKKQKNLKHIFFYLRFNFETKIDLKRITFRKRCKMCNFSVLSIVCNQALLKKCLELWQFLRQFKRLFFHFFLFGIRRQLICIGEGFFLHLAHRRRQRRPQSWTFFKVQNLLKRCLSKIPLKTVGNIWWPKKLGLRPGKRKETQQLT